MRAQIVLPDSLGKALKELVPVRSRSAFIAQAIENRLRHLNQIEALKESAGAWSDADHPELKTQGDVRKYLRRVRRTRKRLA